jgi:putative tryptophan/tyrosine transport system substrate-binding protein
MRRREFIKLFSSTVIAWPLTARAQQQGTPVIGYLNERSPNDSANIVAAFRQGLKEEGYIQGENVIIESRFAEGQVDRLEELAKELIRRGVNVVVATGGTASVIKAKAVVPGTIPIVFAMGGDPVKLGVVASLPRPGGNITGVSFLINELAAKEVELLDKLVPKAVLIGFLVNPSDPNTESDIKETQAAADTLGHKLIVAKASAESEIDPALAGLAQQQIAALFVNAEVLFTVYRAKILAFAARHSVLTICSVEGFAADGGLISYGASIQWANHQLGVYAGRVLKGTPPSDLPVVQPTALQLVINLKTAKALGLTIPPTLLATADEVIE